MSFADEVAACEPVVIRCKTCKHLIDMDPKFRTEVEGVLESSADAAPIAKALTARGYPVQESSVRRHRQENHKDRRELQR